LTAFATEVVPWLAELPSAMPPYDDCPPQAGYVIASKVEHGYELRIRLMTVLDEPYPGETVVSRAPKT